MRVFVFVNNVSDIGYRQTTALLIAAFHNRGHEVFLANVDDLSLVGQQKKNDDLEVEQESIGDLPKTPSRSMPTRFLANAVELSPNLARTINSRNVADFAVSSNELELQQFTIQAGDMIFIRTNPGRDSERKTQHQTFIELCVVASEFGIRVINRPAKLSFYASKSAITVLPARFRPEMIVSSDPGSIIQFVAEAACDCVFKPLVGSRGNDVVLVSKNLPNIERILIERFNNKAVVVQHFVQSDEPGDKRVVVLNGELIQSGKHIAGIHRVPAQGDFRANLHAGGTAHPLTLSDDQHEAVAAAARILYADGIQLAGIDLIGSKVIEFNVFSTGGLFDANRFAESEFEAGIVDRLT